MCQFADFGLDAGTKCGELNYNNNPTNEKKARNIIDYMSDDDSLVAYMDDTDSLLAVYFCSLGCALEQDDRDLSATDIEILLATSYYCSDTQSTGDTCENEQVWAANVQAGQTLAPAVRARNLVERNDDELCTQVCIEALTEDNQGVLITSYSELTEDICTPSPTTSRFC